jgi:hypothetical protein
MRGRFCACSSGITDMMLSTLATEGRALSAATLRVTSASDSTASSPNNGDCFPLSKIFCSHRTDSVPLAWRWRRLKSAPTRPLHQRERPTKSALAARLARGYR